MRCQRTRLLNVLSAARMSNTSHYTRELGLQEHRTLNWALSPDLKLIYDRSRGRDKVMSPAY